MRVLLLWALFTFPCLSAPLLIQNANTYDPSTGETHRGHLLLEAEKISKILTTIPAGYSGEVLDAQWKWVLPGLQDFHVHVHGNTTPSGTYQALGTENSARSMLYAGVTGFLDLFHQENEILGLRDKQRSGKLGTAAPLADIHAAGPIFTSTGGHGTEYGMFTRVIDSPEQAELEIKALAYKKPDVIKIVYDHAVPQFTTMTEPTLKRALEVAREVGIKAVVHIGTWGDAAKAVDFGASAITHTHSDPVPNALVEKFKRKGVVYIPTLVVQMDLLNIAQEPALLERPLLKEMVPTSVISAYVDPAKYFPFAKQWMEWQRKGRGSFQKNFAAFADAGVRIVAGTDVGNLGTFQGYSLHRELELMVQAGASNRLALQAATANACAFVGKECRIRVGDPANLVILENSPLKDIANTQKISAVIYRAQIVDRPRLKDAFSKAAMSRAVLPEAGGISVPGVPPSHAH